MASFSSGSFSSGSFGGLDLDGGGVAPAGLSPLAIAVQGVGFGALLTAVHGFYGTEAPPDANLTQSFVGFISNMGTFMGRM